MKILDVDKINVEEEVKEIIKQINEDKGNQIINLNEDKRNIYEIKTELIENESVKEGIKKYLAESLDEINKKSYPLSTLTSRLKGAFEGYKQLQNFVTENEIVKKYPKLSKYIYKQFENEAYVSDFKEGVKEFKEIIENENFKEIITKLDGDIEQKIVDTLQNRHIFIAYNMFQTLLNLAMRNYSEDNDKINTRVLMHLSIPPKTSIDNFMIYAKFVSMLKEVKQEHLDQGIKKINEDEQFRNKITELKAETTFEELMNEVPNIAELKEKLKGLKEIKEDDLEKNAMAYQIYATREDNIQTFNEKGLKECKKYQNWIQKTYVGADKQKAALDAFNLFYSKIKDDFELKLETDGLKKNLDKFLEIKEENKKNENYVNKVIELFDYPKTEEARKLMDAGNKIVFPDGFDFEKHNEYFINAFNGIIDAEKTQENANIIFKLINKVTDEKVDYPIPAKIFKIPKNGKIDDLLKLIVFRNQKIDEVKNQFKPKQLVKIGDAIRKINVIIEDVLGINETTIYKNFEEVYNIFEKYPNFKRDGPKGLKNYLSIKSTENVELTEINNLLTKAKEKSEKADLELEKQGKEMDKQKEMLESSWEERGIQGDEQDKEIEILNEIQELGQSLENIQNFEKLKEYKLAGGEFTAETIPIIVKLNNAKDAKLLVNRETDDMVDWINNIGGTAVEIYTSGTIDDELINDAEEAAKSMAKEIESLDVDKQENAREIAKKLFEKGMWKVEPNIFKKMTKLPSNQLNVIVEKVGEIDKVKDICLAVSTLENKEIKEKNVKEIIKWDNDRLALTAKIIAEKDIENVEFDNLEKIFKEKKINETQIAVLLGAINGKKYGDIFKNMAEIENVKNPFEFGQELANLEKIDKKIIKTKVKEWQERKETSEVNDEIVPKDEINKEPPVQQDEVKSDKLLLKRLWTKDNLIKKANELNTDVGKNKELKEIVIKLIEEGNLVDAQKKLLAQDKYQLNNNIEELDSNIIKNKLRELVNKDYINEVIKIVSNFKELIKSLDNLNQLNQYNDAKDKILNKYAELVNANKFDEAHNMFEEYTQLIRSINNLNENNEYEEVKKYIINKYANEGKEVADKLIRMINNDLRKEIVEKILDKNNEKIIKVFDTILTNKWEPDSYKTTLCFMRGNAKDMEKVVNKINAQENLKTEKLWENEDNLFYSTIYYSNFLKIIKNEDITQANVNKFIELLEKKDENFNKNFLELDGELSFDQIMKVSELKEILSWKEIKEKLEEKDEK